MQRAGHEERSLITILWSFWLQHCDSSNLMMRPEPLSLRLGWKIIKTENGSSIVGLLGKIPVTLLWLLRTPFKDIFTQCFEDMLTQCFKICLFYIWRHAEQMLEDISTHCLKTCFPNIWICVYPMLEDMCIQEYTYMIMIIIKLYFSSSNLQILKTIIQSQMVFLRNFLLPVRQGEDVWYIYRPLYFLSIPPNKFNKVKQDITK